MGRGAAMRVANAAIAALAASVAAASSAGAAPSAPATFEIGWTVDSIGEDKVHHEPVTHAHLTLTNTGKTPIAPGWSLWFTAIGFTETADPTAPVERVTGGLFRMTPKRSAPVLPGETIELPVDHPSEIVRDDKGPTGPYLVLAGQPDVGLAPTRYTAIGPRRTTPGVPKTQFTDSAQTYADNEAWTRADAVATPPLLPTPRQWRYQPGRPVAIHLGKPRLGPGLGAVATRAHDVAAATARSGPVRPFSIRLGAVAGQSSREAYRLTVGADGGAAIVARSPAGAFAALASLQQLAARPATRPVVIVDAPRFAHRGMMLDLARNFRNLNEIEPVVEGMARLKLNVLHLHLADDEGWRIAIPALPELTEVGARRGHCAPCLDRLPPALGSGPSVEDRYGSGYLSGEDYVALLRFAADRGITVIPEIDMPGHMRAAIRSMEARARAHPEEGERYRLADPGDRSAYSSAQSYTDNVADPALPGFERFVDTVVAELARLHRVAGMPLTRMHVGADEAPDGAWTMAPAAQARMKTLGHPGSRAALWEDMIARLDAIVARHGARLEGWEELGMVAGSSALDPAPRFANRGMTVQVWNTLDGNHALGNRLANAGYEVVMSPASNLYLDMVALPDPEEPGHDWVAPTSLAKIYDYDPEQPVAGVVPLTAAGRRRLLGLEGTLFSETVRGDDRLGYAIFPRLVAVAERAWAPRPAWSHEVDPDRAAARRLPEWAGFSRALGEAVLPMFDRDLPAIAYRLPAPGLTEVGGKVVANYPWPGVTLRFTRDGSMPTATSPVVEGPLDHSPLLTIAAFTTSGRRSPSITLPRNQ